MNEEPLVLPDTCGLFLGTGGAGPRALRFSAVPGKSAHVMDITLLYVYIYTTRDRDQRKFATSRRQGLYLLQTSDDRSQEDSPLIHLHTIVYMYIYHIH